MGKTSGRKEIDALSKVQAKLRNEWRFQESFLPEEEAPIKCSYLTSSNVSLRKNVVIFVPSSSGSAPGLWDFSLASQYGLNATMLPYIEMALQNNYGVVLSNPFENSRVVEGMKEKIPRSGSPWEHLGTITSQLTAVEDAKVENIFFLGFSAAGAIMLQAIEAFDEEIKEKIRRVVLLESSHTMDEATSAAAKRFFASKVINFKSHNSPLYSKIGGGPAIAGGVPEGATTALNYHRRSNSAPGHHRRSSLSSTTRSSVSTGEDFDDRAGCVTLSSGHTTRAEDAAAWTLAAVQMAVFVCFQGADKSFKETHRALRATIPNKLVITVNRARLKGPPLNNPFAVVLCANQKREIVGGQRYTVDPEWNQVASFPVMDGAQWAHILIKDRSFPGLSQVVGQASISMVEMVLHRAQKRWVLLRDEKTGGIESRGEIEITAEWVHDTFVARSDSFVRSSRERDSFLGKGVGDESHCYLCGCNFRLHRRRHCRMCLRAVCVACSDRLFVPGLAEARRVCTACTNLQIMMNQQGADRAATMELVEAFKRAEPFEGASDGALNVNDFQLLKVVGRGAFGKVLLVRKLSGKNAGKIYAMKILRKAHIIKNDQVENTKAEQQILKEIDHPFIVRLRYAFQNTDKLYLIMDFYPGGSLFYHLRLSKRFDEDRTRLYAAELLLALAHLHSKNIAYRDLKLENILIDSDGHIALTDFGLSKEYGEDKGVSPDGMRTICGTAEYMAPELLRHHPYSKAVDWWSYGVLMYEMLVGRTPFVDRNRRQMFKNIMNMPIAFPDHVSEVVRDLIVKLLNRDPSSRLGADAEGPSGIMRHAFFASIDWSKLMRKELTPPFLPNVSGLDDTSNIPQMFQTMAAVDSPTHDSQHGELSYADHHFEDFSYVESSTRLSLLTSSMLRAKEDTHSEEEDEGEEVEQRQQEKHQQQNMHQRKEGGEQNKQEQYHMDGGRQDSFNKNGQGKDHGKGKCGEETEFQHQRKISSGQNDSSHSMRPQHKNPQFQRKQFGDTLSDDTTRQPESVPS